MKVLKMLSLALMVVLTGCSGCNDDSAAKETARLRDKFADQDITYGGDPLPPEADLAEIRKGVQGIAETTNDVDWVSHAELIHPALFKTDSAKIQMIEQATRFSDSGWMSTYEKWEIQDISPYVDYAGGKASLINLDKQVRIWFTDAWTGRPENYYNMIRDRHPSNDVTFNIDDSTFTITGKDVVIAMKEDSSDRFYFIQRAAMQEDEIKVLFQPQDMQMLASYEH